MISPGFLFHSIFSLFYPLQIESLNVKVRAVSKMEKVKKKKEENDFLWWLCCAWTIGETEIRLRNLLGGSGALYCIIAGWAHGNFFFLSLLDTV